MILNPTGRLLPAIASRLRRARKAKPIWARRVEVACEVESIEGRLQAQPGDYLCRGIAGEQWPQKESKLLEKYSPSDQLGVSGWQRFDPKEDSEPVEATRVDQSFRVISQWGELAGKANDYVVRSKSDPTDIWVVDNAIFEASYEFVSD